MGEVGVEGSIEICSLVFFFGDFNAMCGREERRGINNMYRVIGWRGIYLIN